jgi:20S proteasome alpha/beta subunit
VSVPGAFKYHEKKIAVEVGSVWKVAFAFSGEPGFAREVQEKVMAAIRLLPTETPDGAQVKEILDDVLSNTTRLYTQGDAPLQLLVSLAIWMERPELLKFDGRALHAADNFNCLGVGNSPLIRFLSDTLYSPDIDLKTGVALAAYFIRKAEQYIDWCGGPIDVVTIEDYEDFCQWIPEDEITQKIEQMEKEEKLISRLLLRGVSSSNAL